MIHLSHELFYDCFRNKHMCKASMANLWYVASLVNQVQQTPNWSFRGKAVWCRFVSNQFVQSYPRTHTEICIHIYIWYPVQF